jgi:dihydrofolate reductase
MIIGIVAISKNYAIGKDGKLPWHYPADLKHFRNTTTGNAIVMGRTTWKGLGWPLPERLNIVLSRSGTIDDQHDVIQLKSKAQTLELAKYLNCDLFIIGGAKTYENFSDVIEKWIVTEVPETVEEADVFMPKDFLDGFRSTEKTGLGDGLSVTIFVR